ncbi:hypothetical protein H1R20_g12716, partial [Candolleomyces eurysporus]
MSSPALVFSHLLSTNDPLSPDEKQHARLQVSTLKKRVDDLRLLCRQIESEVEEYHFLLSPWRDIPVEIIGTIFKFIIPPVVTAKSAKDLGNLRLVCKKWRDVADLTHQLWSGLEIDVRYPPELSHEKLSSWLNKAGDLQRTLVVRGDLHQVGEPCRLAHPVLCRILVQGPTIDTLEISCVSIACFNRLIQEIQSHAARQEITSRWHSISSLTLSLENLVILERTPSIFPTSLTSLAVIIGGKPVYPSGDGLILGFIYPAVLERLIDFTFICFQHDILPSILPAVRHCLNTEVLEIIGGHQDRQVRALQPFLQQGHDGERIFLPKLKTLRLGGLCSSLIPSALETIQAPNLVHLDVDLSFARDSRLSWIRACYMCADGERLEDVVRPSTIPAANLACRTSLKQLRIRSAVMPYPATLLQILVNLPSLVRLTLDDIVVNKNLDLGLSMEDQVLPTPLDGWPCIEVLEFLGSTKDHFANSPVMEVLVPS